jgi:hypothetical protein
MFSQLKLHYEVETSNQNAIVAVFELIFFTYLLESQIYLFLYLFKQILS